VVDLDGALVGAPANQAGLREILRAVRVPVQVGGGLRTLEALAAALDLGASVGIVGTAAIRDPKFLEAACRAFPGRIALTLDARKGMLSVAGWAEASSCRATDLARETTSLPLAAVIYTDIQRDGTLHGPDLDGLGAVTDATDIPVIASGGIASASDIHALRRLRPGRVVGAILGRALYDGGLTLEAALAAAEAAC
jgi:phosphoribosylformimino-5-aminoimidazole carboxamide ribotide isomerase